MLVDLAIRDKLVRKADGVVGRSPYGKSRFSVGRALVASGHHIVAAGVAPGHLGAMMGQSPQEKPPHSEQNSDAADALNRLRQQTASEPTTTLEESLSQEARRLSIAPGDSTETARAKIERTFVTLVRAKKALDESAGAMGRTADASRQAIDQTQIRAGKLLTAAAQRTGQALAAMENTTRTLSEDTASLRNVSERLLEKLDVRLEKVCFLMYLAVALGVFAALCAAGSFLVILLR